MGEGICSNPAQSTRSLRPNLPLPPHYILIGRELLSPHGTPRMEPVRGDADFGAEAELAAVGELG